MPFSQQIWLCILGKVLCETCDDHNGSRVQLIPETVASDRPVIAASCNKCDDSCMYSIGEVITGK